MCGAHYTITAKHRYGCQSYHDGDACTNAITVRKDEVEDVLIRGEESGLAALLAPDRIERMGKAMERYYAERQRTMQARATEAPKELQELAARIERLRERLRKGDPDMTADEIAAAIERAEGKRRELEQQQPAARATAKVLTMLPRTAEMYRRQVLQGLDGNVREALKARVFLREWSPWPTV